MRIENKQAIPTGREEKVSPRNYSLSGMPDAIAKICHDLSMDNHHDQRSTSDVNHTIKLVECAELFW